MSLVCYTIYAVGLSITPGSLFIRRVLFIPAQVNFYYYDFFSTNELTYLSQSHLGLPFSIQNPYEGYDNTAKMMGALYTNNPECHMNVGYMGDAYMNFGSLGVLLFSVILGVIFLVLDSIAARTSKIIAVAAMALPIKSLINGALFTVLGTHGLLLSILMVSLYSKRRKEKTKKVEVRS